MQRIYVDYFWKLRAICSLFIIYGTMKQSSTYAMQTVDADLNGQDWPGWGFDITLT